MAPNKKSPRIFKAEMWRNNWIVSLVILLVVLNLGLMLFMLTQIQPVQSLIPTRYTSFANFDQLGSWWELFLIPISSLVITGVNIGLAQAIYRRSRISSMVLIIATLCMTILAFQIANFFIGVTYGAR